MSLNLTGNMKFNEDIRHFDINETTKIYTRTVVGPNPGKTALYIHGGGSGGNHTMLLRPAKWLIEKGLFSKVILPDRRGEGYSTPLTSKLSIKDHASDMKALLDKMEIEGDVTVLGLSYGGPIAIELASMDSRIKEVILVASSPSLKDVNGLRGILYRSNLLEKISTSYYKKNLGKLPATYPDFENVYELKSNKELTEYFVHCIKQTDSKMLESIVFQNKSTLDQSNNGISDGFNLDIPIYQVIGSKDEIWETDIISYKKRFSSLKTKIIDGYEHKDAILKADLFYNALLEIYS